MRHDPPRTPRTPAPLDPAPHPGTNRPATLPHDDGWRFHTGIPAPLTARLLRFMTRRWRWALLRHGWRGPIGIAVVLGATGAAAAGIIATTLMPWAPELLLLPLAVIPAAAIAVTAGQVTIRGVWRRRLQHPDRWVPHWCEGPHGELAIRWTRPLPADHRPERWYGMDLYGSGGAGRRLLHWLQRRADACGAVLVIRTNRPPLVTYYQSCGFVISKEAPVSLGRWTQIGTTVLYYPATSTWRPGRKAR
ncbi:GNAT family N-acetyltransferase [Salinispora arenicola]|uniref:GNAT family N-acetyltransferase n=1 Tax=Salinispora arenicola TaxID=168697 RepID=UPI00037C39A4|nr:GNAT family N-acetyltransferase [Salinispora arenicola]